MERFCREGVTCGWSIDGVAASGFAMESCFHFLCGTPGLRAGEAERPLEPIVKRIIPCSLEMALHDDAYSTPTQQLR